MKPLLDRKVRDFMKRDIISVKLTDPATRVISLLSDKEISGLIVVDNAGEVVGVISGMDIFKLLNREKNIELNYTAEEIMTPYTVTITPNADLHDAGSLMLENGIHRLVVTESPLRKRPIGIISSSDIIREIKRLI